MKIAIKCDSPLLQQSLELFLAGHLTSIKQADLVICDKKSEDASRSIYIGTDDDADVKKPFSRSQLLLAIESKLQANNSITAYNDMIEEEKPEVSETVTPAKEVINEALPNFELLERRIAMLTREYQENIMKAVRAFHG